MATEAARPRKKEGKNSRKNKTKTTPHLTLTGLLMEGLRDVVQR
jgi:hypothetical protein